jgi:hypothetical protein
MPFEVSWCPKLTKSEKRSISKPSPPFRRRNKSIRWNHKQLYEFDISPFRWHLFAKMCAATAKVGARGAAMEPQGHPKCPKVTKGHQHVSEGWRNVGQGVVQWTPKVKPAHGLHRIRHACPWGAQGNSRCFTPPRCARSWVGLWGWILRFAGPVSGNWILGFGSDGAVRLHFRVCWACVGELDFRVWLGWGFEV